MARDKEYIPALNKDWLTPVYDPLIRIMMREQAFKQRLVERVNLQPGDRVLDLGCGTGTLAVMLQRHQPQAVITGLDGDERMLEMARRKTRQDGLDQIRWEKGLAYELPYPDETFDGVVSSLMTHHLTAANKRKTFAETRRVLKPGGRFFIADFGAPHDGLMRLVAAAMMGLEEARENLKGELPALLREAGFSSVSEVDHFRTIFGPLSIYMGS